MPSPLVDGFHAGFDRGRTVIVREADGRLVPGLDLDIVVQQRGDAMDVMDGKESAWLLLGGRAAVTFDAVNELVERDSIFDAPPAVLHLASRTAATIVAQSERVEWAVVRATNARPFAPRLFTPDGVTAERRGAGLAQGACARTVRLVFDRTTRPESEIVLGEVVGDAGRWSSYPPHHHAQPELYHYRFSAPQGWGHAELGDAVFKVQSHDTLCIPPHATHAQVAAAGYAMWYLWAVRHIPGAPYDGFTYDARHTWLLDPAAQGWAPATAAGVRP
jgi:5-deoxy-glucuronate isomerase